MSTTMTTPKDGLRQVKLSYQFDYDHIRVDFSEYDEHTLIVHEWWKKYYINDQTMFVDIAMFTHFGTDPNKKEQEWKSKEQQLSG